MFSRGQQFEGFKLLIAATMAILILAIILGIVNQLNQQRFEISTQNMVNGVITAVASPDGRVVRIQALSFSKDTIFSQAYFSKKTGVEESCFSFDTTNSKSFKKLGGAAIQINSEVTTDVFAQCCTIVCENGNKQCKVYFGKSITESCPP